MSRIIVNLAIVLYLTLLAAGSILLTKPPRPVPASAPAMEFSAERAMAHVKAITAQPHPMGTAEHARVRDYLLDELRRLGLEPQVQRATGVTARYAVAGTVENIVARLKGTGQGPAIALVAHYDSVPVAPGAGDDAAGVAAILETVRAVRAGAPLRNDVIVLISDGEEDGFMGASAFLAEHPWAKQIGVALNFEGRGNRGPSKMFETSPGNGWLIREFARVTPHPDASSLAYEMYRRMPNDTDFTIFRKQGVAGLNFAFIEGWAAYHTPRDSAEALDGRSVQHHGSYALALARHFGNLELTNIRTGDAVYFSLPGVAFVHYPQAWVTPLAVVGLLLLAGMVMLEWRAGRLTKGGLLGGFLVFLVSVPMAAGAGVGFWYGVRWLHRNWAEGDIARSGMYALSVLAFVVALTTALYVVARVKLRMQSLALGGLLGWLVLAAVTAWRAPGASYLFTWPLLAGLLSVWIAGAFEAGEPILRGGFLVLGVLAAPVVLLFAPMLDDMFAGLGVTKMGAPAFAGALAMAPWVLIPLLEHLTRPKRWMLPALAFGAGVVFLVAGALTAPYDSEHPKPGNVFYALDTDTGKAVWVVWASGSERPNEWTEQFVTSSPRKGALPEFVPAELESGFLYAEAPAMALVAPRIEWIEKKEESGTLRAQLRVGPARGGHWLLMFFEDADVVAAWVNGRAVERAPDARRKLKKGWILNYANPPEAGIGLTLEIQGVKPMKMRVVEGSLGLPQIPGTLFRPRPKTLMPIQSGDQTLVSRSFTF